MDLLIKRTGLHNVFTLNSPSSPTHKRVGMRNASIDFKMFYLQRQDLSEESVRQLGDLLWADLVLYDIAKEKFEAVSNSTMNLYSRQ